MMRRGVKFDADKSEKSSSRKSRKSVDEALPPDFISLSVLVDVTLELAPDGGTASSSSSATGALTYRVTGPKRPLELLRKLGLSDEEALTCKISPLSPVTVPVQFRKGAGIPEESASFAFIYPWLGKELEELNFAKDSWAFVLLLGGFAYFSEDGELMRVNALTLAPSEAGLMLVGPHVATREAYDAMVAQQRMKPSTSPELRKAGFARFGWVHPSETFDGAFLGECIQTQYRRRSVSEPRDSEHAEEGQPETEIFFYSLITPGDALYARLAKMSTTGSKKKLRSSKTFLSAAYEAERKTSKDAIKAKRAAAAVFKAHEKEESSVTVRQVALQTLRAIAYVSIYVGLGMLFYMTSETRDCADDEEGSVAVPIDALSSSSSSVTEISSGTFDGFVESALNATDVVLCRWTAIDTLYFILATSSTVGYGDMVPSTWGSRLFTVPFMLVGVAVVFTIAGDSVVGSVAFLEQLFYRLVGKLAACVCRRAASKEDPAGNFKVPPAWRFYFGRLAFSLFFGLGTTQFLAAWLFTLVQPGLTFAEAMWHCFVTSTTVGYGESVLDQPTSRALASAHILLSTSWLASVVQQVKTARQERHLQLDRAKLFLRQLDDKIVDKLDKDGTGVDQLEFVVGLLTALGVQLCGEPLNFERDVQPLLDRFQALDVKRTGRLSKDDLRFMVSEAQREHIQTAQPERITTTGRERSRRLTRRQSDAALSQARAKELAEMRRAVGEDDEAVGGRRGSSHDAGLLELPFQTLEAGLGKGFNMIAEGVGGLAGAGKSETEEEREGATRQTL